MPDETKGNVKVDHIIHDNHRIGFLFNITRFRQIPGADGPPGLPVPLYNGVNSFFTGSLFFTRPISRITLVKKRE